MILLDNWDLNVIQDPNPTEKKLQESIEIYNRESNKAQKQWKQLPEVCILQFWIRNLFLIS